MAELTDKIPVLGKLTVSGQSVADTTDTISPVTHDIVIVASGPCPTCGRRNG